MSFRYIRKHIDYVVALLGICAMASLILFEEKGSVIPVIKYAAGIIGLIYIFQFLYLWLFRRISFDWYLVFGNYLMKVLCVVLLTPSIITMLISLPSDCGLTTAIDEKELIYAPELYECGDADIPHSIREKQENPGLFWSIYYHYIDSGNQHMTTTKYGRFISAVVTLLGVFLMNGLLVSSVVGWIDRRKERWRKGEIRYSGLHLGRTPHSVIIGGHDSIYGVVKSIFDIDDTGAELPCKKKRKIPFLLIQTSQEVESFRRELFSTLSEEYQEKVIIYYGNRTSESDLNMLALKKAKEVYVLGEDVAQSDKESYHDTMNMVCIKNISKYVNDVEKFCIDKETGEDNRLICRVIFEYQATFNIFQTTDINHKRIKFLPLNYYEMWAQKVLIRQEIMEKINGTWTPLEEFKALNRKNIDSYFPLEGYDGIKSDEDEFVHLVVIGMSRMGIALAIEAAHLAHYPNFETRKKCTRITFVDPSMEQERNFFMGRFKELFSVARQRYVSKMHDGIYDDTIRFPWVNPLDDKCGDSEYKAEDLGCDFIDVEWEFINGSVEAPAVQQYLIDAAANKDAKLTIAICLPENSKAVASAAYIDDKVYSSDSLLQVLVYQRLNDELINQINENARYNGRLKAFGMSNECFELSLIEIAESVSKNIDVAYCECSDKQTRSMIERLNREGISDDILMELCPTIDTLDNQQQIYVRKQWEEWLEENRCFHSGWRKSKKNKHKEIHEYLYGEEQQVSKGKSNSAKMWSSRYNINSMWTKFRCVKTEDGRPFNPLEEGSGFSKEMLEELGITEHNRWCTEQLLLRYRPLTTAEQMKAKMPKQLSPDIEKDALKAQFAHVDICSNKRLKEIDCNMPEFDVELTSVLPVAYREYMKRHISL